MSETPNSTLAELTSFVERIQPKHRVFGVRVVAFLCGGGVNFAVNGGTFWLLTHLAHLQKNAAYAGSLAVTTVALFLYSYFVNFRTSKAWHDCIGRYLTVFGLTQALNYVVTTRIGFHFFPQLEYFVIAVTPMLLAGFKFALYNWWVFPHQTKPLANG
jgi:putative flippase GtrA